VMQSYIAEGEQLAGRIAGSVRVVLGAVTVVDEDRSAARQAAREAAVLYLPVVAPLDPTAMVEPELVERLRGHADRGEAKEGARLISDDLLDRFAFSGNAADLIAQAERCFAAGAGRIEFGTPHGLLAETGIHIIGEKVLPALRNF
jgi:5,10-methylenetetrahydromethanopterin reductase